MLRKSKLPLAKLYFSCKIEHDAIETGGPIDHRFLYGSFVWQFARILEEAFCLIVLFFEEKD